MEAELSLFEVGVLFASVAIVGVLARQLRQSVIPFYIGVGVPLSPYVAGRVGHYALENMEFIEIGAELGIVFLGLFLGFEFNLERLFENADHIGKVGTIDLAFNFGAGLVLGYALFGSLLLAFVVAGIVDISSSPSLRSH